jgi:hypothetical protein
MGWFIVGEEPNSLDNTVLSQVEWERAKQLLRESDWTMLPDVPMTAGDKEQWIEYRRQLREIRLQSEFPVNIEWPIAPE